jgi:hypothetical protein
MGPIQTTCHRVRHEVISFLELEPDGAANPQRMSRPSGTPFATRWWSTHRRSAFACLLVLALWVRALGPSITASAALTEPVERRPGYRRLGREASCALASSASCASASAVPTLLRSESGPCPLGEQASRRRLLRADLCNGELR